MSDEKIISLRTRKPVEQPQAAPPEPIVQAGLPDDVHVDQDTLSQVSEFMSHVISGQLSGCVLIGWDRNEKRFFTSTVMPEDDHVDNSAFKFIGALEATKAWLLKVADEAMVEGTEP
jgi:hypothetical protein